MRTVRRLLDRATHLISDLLDFTAARVGAGLSISVASVDLHATVAEAVDALRVAYPARSIVHVAEGAGACIVDPDATTFTIALPRGGSSGAAIPSRA